MIIYIDESGDLGLKTNKSSKEFIITALTSTDKNFKKHINNTIRKTLSHKSAKGLKELKGHSTSLNTKKYFYEKLKEFKGDWKIYTYIIKKNLSLKVKTFDFYADTLLCLIEKIKFNLTADTILIIIDKLFAKEYESLITKKITLALASKNFKNRLEIKFIHSCNEPGLQAVDQFCTGISRKYRLKNMEWYSLFSEKITCEIAKDYKK